MSLVWPDDSGWPMTSAWRTCLEASCKQHDRDKGERRGEEGAVAEELAREQALAEDSWQIC